MSNTPEKRKLESGEEPPAKRMADGPTKIMVIGGKTGWIGKQLVDLLKAQGIEWAVSQARMENREAFAAELDEVKPTHVINAGGATGRPNVDWCESHKQETIRSNVIGMLNVADLCEARGIHHTLLATGCIFEYDEAHPMGSGIGFKEDDPPNFKDSWYSETKGYLEPMVQCFGTSLILRLRMPISDDLNHRNFVTKILKYDRVVNIPNSMTVLAELVPAIIKLAQANEVGVLNFCNPGAISHNQVLDLYKEEVDPQYTYKNFTLEEQAKVLAAGRSNNELDSTNLMAAMARVNHPVNEIVEAVRQCMKRMKQNLMAADPEHWEEKLPRRSK